MAFQGLYVALPTLLTAAGEVEAERTRALVRDLADRGVDGLWLLGGAGGGPAVPLPTARTLVETVAEEAAGALPIVVGVSAASTEAALDRARELVVPGVAAIFSTPPLYYTCTSQELVAFYSRLAEEGPAPVLLYNSPAAAGTSISMTAIATLCGHERIAGLKDSGGDLRYTAQAVNATQGASFGVAQGLEHLAEASLNAGAHGLVSALGGLAPDLLLELRDAHRDGRRAAARTAQRAIDDALRALHWDDATDAQVLRSLAASHGCEAGVPHPFGSLR